MNRFINELFKTPVKYVKLPDSTEFHSYYYFQINDNGYRVNISRLATKEKKSYILALSSMSPSGKSMVQFKYIPKDAFQVISTVYAIFDEWMEVHKKLFAALAIRLPDKFTTNNISLVRRMILRNKKKYPKLEEIPLSGIEEAKNKYIFLQNTSQSMDSVIKSLMYKGFDEYDFKGAFPAELLDSIMLKTVAQKSHMLDNLNLLSANYSDDDVEDIASLMFKQLTPTQIKFTEKTEAAIQVMNKTDVVVNDSAEAQAVTPKEQDIEFWWFSPIGNQRRVLILNEFIGRVIEKSQNLNGLLDVLTRSEISKPFEHVGIFEEICANEFPKWDRTGLNYLSLTISLRNCFMALESKYLKWVDFWNENNSEYMYWTPYVLYVIAKLSDTKSKSTESHLLDVPNKNFIVGYYTALVNNCSTGNTGAFKYSGISTAIFPAMYEYWDLVRFSKGLGIAKDTTENIDVTLFYDKATSTNYYDVGKIEKKFDDIFETEETITLEYIPLDDLEEPESINNIYSAKNAAFLEKKMAEIQSKKCQPDNIPNILSYTGSGYTTINGGLRNKTIGKLNKNTILAFLEEYEKYGVTLVNDIEVSRKTDVPMSISLNQVYIDPGALSTSVSSKVWSGTTKMRIKIPKGSKVFFAVSQFSNNSQEKEIILPPGSIIKPYRKTVKKNSKQIWYDCLYMGNVMSYMKDVLEGKVQKKEQMFDLEADDGEFAGVSESLDDMIPKTPLGQSEYDRTDEINKEHLFQNTDDIIKMIKSGKITPDWTFNQKKK